MRAWILCAALVIGCDGGGGCLIDSDCADFSLVCIEQECVPAGTVRVDSGAPTSDAGPASDAGRGDAGIAGDAGRDGGMPACPNAGGGYAIASLAGTCTNAMVGYLVNVNADVVPCQFTAMSAVMDQPGLDGSFTIDGAGAINGTLSAGGATAEGCTGTLVDTTMTITCGACMMTLNRT